jgi:O-antigen ligase
VLVWRRHSIFLIAAMVLALVFAGFASPQIRHRVTGKTSSSLSNVTSGRSTLATRGVKLALHHPLLGVGVGGFKRAYADLAHLRGKEPKAAASHTTPITVAAETGFPGLAVFLALVVVSLGTAFRRIRDGFDANARLAFGLALTAIFVHSVFYNALFEDPTFWGLLGLIAVAVRAEEAA